MTTITTTTLVIEKNIAQPKVRPYNATKKLYRIVRVATGHVLAETTNLRSWCRENKQSYNRLYQTIKGLCRPVRGYVVERVQ